MSGELKPKPVHERGEEHRARPRPQDPWPIEIWVPDIDSPAFKAEAHRQSLAIATSGDDDEDQAFINAVTDWSDA